MLHPTPDYTLGLRARIAEVCFSLSLQQQNFISGQKGKLFYLKLFIP
jgi:hypothetical protein